MNAFGFVLDDASLRRAAVEGVPETVIAAIYLLHERGVGEVAAKLTRRRARRLIKEKGELRNVELAAGERPFERLREGRPESIETSSLHLDVLRDLRRIHSHLCSVAYPVLEAAGELPAPAAAQPESAAAAVAYQEKRL